MRPERVQHSCLAATVVLAAKPAGGHLAAMPVSSAYRPDPRLGALGPEFADAVRPADFPQAIPRFWNERWAARIGLDALTAAEREAAFARFEPLPDNQPAPLAMRYHGHQFRGYNPDLGDGRGFLYGQVRDDAGRLLDLATKGSGQTPWSRAGDGRLTLKGGVREVLATAMLEALGVPTSKSFALYETGEALHRGDEPSPTRSAVLTRLSHSHIRFGTFQRLAYFDRADLITGLIDHVVELYYPELAEAADRPAALLDAVVGRSAVLAASWMAAGFVHGVLNTDNMNVTGESFDYGPWRFLPFSDPGFTAAYFDQYGLYSFGRQPEAVFWNLQQFAACLTLVADQAPLIAALNGFLGRYRSALAAAALRRLGVAGVSAEADAALAEAALRALSEGDPALGWEPFFFDWFGGSASERRALEGPRGSIYGQPVFTEFRDRLSAHRTECPDRLGHSLFGEPEPETLLIEEVEELWGPIAERDDWTALDAKLARLDEVRLAYGMAAEA